MNTKNKLYEISRDYTIYGFCNIIINKTRCPFCFLCKKTFSIYSSTPTKMKRHFMTHKPYLQFSYEKMKNLLKKFLEMPKITDIATSFDKDNILKISFFISYQIGKNKKEYIIGEKMIIDILKETAKLVFNIEDVSIIDKIPLSNDTVKRRLDFINFYLKKILISELKNTNTKIYLQLDETTDVANMCQVICFVRYFYNGHIKESLLFIKELKSRSRGIDIFNLLKKFFLVIMISI